MMKKLMERVRMIRENQKKNGTKGFSMIELIIVIAVMAILIALIGTQLIPYLEKSRKTRDLDTLNAVLTAAQSVCTDFEIDPTDSSAVSGIPTNHKSEFETYLGYQWSDAPKKFSSKAAKGSGTSVSAPTISVVTISGKPAIMVKVGDLFVTSGGVSSANSTTVPAAAGGGSTS